MDISYNWLKEYLPISETPEQVAARLVTLGLEVEHTHIAGGDASKFDGIVVGEVLSAVQHPNADRLRVCMVNLGSGEPVQIVCGAPNVAAGQKVPVATIGTTVHPTEGEPFKIKKGKIRGEESNGMICAEDELGIGTSHDGILVLDAALQPGTPFVETLTLDTDAIFEIGLTPNRVDAASHYGVARDLAASYGTKASLPAITAQPGNTPGPITVEVQDSSRCQRYTSLYISGVTVGESPEWLKKRLESIGLRPRNNVVDITNFVLHECGQPLHAFDAATIGGGKIIVRTPDTETAFTTLEGTARSLRAGEDLAICDAEKPLCIAGVMGGLNSGVTESTTEIFLESAYFSPTTVRKTARRLGISSDSSFRFERGADPNMTEYAALRAASLIVEIAGGTVSAVSDWKTGDFPPHPVEISLNKLKIIIGKDLSDDEIFGILHGLEIETNRNGDRVTCLVPAYRVDVTRAQDIAEEVLRVYGYNNVEIPASLHHTLDFGQHTDLFSLRQRYCDYLSSTGFYEVLNNSLIPGAWGGEKAVPLQNPLSEELNVMRTSLLPGILDTLAFNQNRQAADLKVYEYGKTYHRTAKGHDEQEWIALAVTGSQHAPHWQAKPGKNSLFTLTREAERMLELFALKGTVAEIESDDLAYGLSLSVNKVQIARWGKVSGDLTRRHDLRNEVFYMEINWLALVAAWEKTKFSFTPIPQYPGTRRDVSMLLDTATSYTAVETAIRSANQSLIRSVSLQDVYTGDKLPAGKKSYLVSVELRDDTKTLGDDTVDKVMARVFQLLENQAKAEIRKN